MKINANIIILLDVDDYKQYRNMKHEEIAKADIILGVFHPGTSKEFTYVYKCRWGAQSYAIDTLSWQNVLSDILTGAEKLTVRDAALANLPVFDVEKAVKDEDYRKSVIDWLNRLP